MQLLDEPDYESNYFLLRLSLFGFAIPLDKPLRTPNQTQLCASSRLTDLARYSGEFAFEPISFAA